MIIDIKIEHTTEVDINFQQKKEVVKIGLFNKNGKMQENKIRYKIEHGKVKAL